MTVPYTFANRTGNIPLSELDANFSNVSNYSATAGTVINAAQPNITSVGTLSSLTVGGGIAGSSLSVTGNITGANLTVTGNVTAGNIIGTVIGSISNAVYATTAGTVTTGAQPNITSVGTLTSLAVTGNVSAGNISASGNIDAANLNTTANVTSSATVRGVTVLATGNLVGGNANITNSVNSVNIVSANVFTTAIFANTIGTTGNVNIGGILSSPQKTRASNDPGSTGEICWDSSYIYVCISANTWARANLVSGY